MFENQASLVTSEPIDVEIAIGSRAAQYVRMSTEHQKYSPVNQAAAIAAYATHRNLTIVRTYADYGRSGVKIDGRDALQRLIADVQTGQADFKFVLVYDISRWGRFQDADESAYYEFICKEAGIHVMYCAEQFENDGSLVSAILKNMKRVMAGEYSRELSTKVYAGQSRGAALGFWQGGPAGYGFRRQLLGEDGIAKGRLEYGQQKSIQTDRVVLVLGPQSEQKVVKRIFHSFAIDKKSRTQIAVELNAEKILNSCKRPWTLVTIHNILKNEKYIGHHIYGRKSLKIGQKQFITPPETWTRHDNAHTAIITPELFAQAQKLIANRDYRRSDQEMLDLLAALWRKKGNLTSFIIATAKGVPKVSNYVSRFGSLLAAYERIGFKAESRYYSASNRIKIEAIIDKMVEEIVSNVERLGGSVTYLRELNLLTINGKLTISVGVATSVSDGNIRDRRWQLRKFKYNKADLSLVLKMGEFNSEICAYYLLPTAHLKMNYRLRLGSRVFATAYRHDNLDALYRMWARNEALPRPNSSNGIMANRTVG